MPKRKEIEYAVPFEEALQVAQDLRNQELDGVTKEEYGALVNLLIPYFKDQVRPAIGFSILKRKEKEFKERFRKPPVPLIKWMLASGYPDSLEKARERHRKTPTTHSPVRFVETKAALGNPNASPEAIEKAYEEDLRHIELARFQIRAPQIVGFEDIVARITQSVLAFLLAQQGEKSKGDANRQESFDERLATAVVQKLGEESHGQIKLDVSDHRIRTAIAISRKFMIPRKELPEIESICLSFPLGASQEYLVGQAREILDEWQARFVKFRGKKVPQRKGQHFCEPWLVLADQLSKDKPLPKESRPTTRAEVIKTAMKTIEENDPEIWSAMLPGLKKHLLSSVKKSRPKDGQH